MQTISRRIALGRILGWFWLALGVTWHAPALWAADWHAAVRGSEKGRGSAESPWDLTSALKGKQKVAPGDTLWVHGGYYRCSPNKEGLGFKVKLAGKEDAPIQVRAWRGERVIIDGGLNIQAPSTHLWVWDFEILVSEPRPAEPVPPTPGKYEVGRPWGGVNIYSGEHCKFINLVIHDNCQGASWWVQSVQSEFYGCIIFDNGWQGTDRGHGHGIYTQNKTGWKQIRDCIFTGGFGYAVHAYGSENAYVDQYLAEGNIFYNSGDVLFGGGRPSRQIHMLNNFFYDVSLRLGYNAPYNVDCELRGNIFLKASPRIKNFQHVIDRGNLVLEGGLADTTQEKFKAARGFSGALLQVNRYDPNRAHLVVFNWFKQSKAPVDLGSFLKPQERFQLHNPREVFGKPVFAGTYPGKPIPVPMEGEIGVFVLRKGAGAE